MKKSVLKFFFSLFLLCPIMASAQFYSDLALYDSTKLSSHKQTIGISFNGLAFFKNNEYFHPLVEGYTLPGFHLQPRLYYDIDEKFRLEAGVHLSQFSGKKGLNSIEPLFRATYSPSKSFSVLLGWLKGTSNHKLIEPLYQWERMFTAPVENGVQFLVDKPGFKLDTWIDWERYIELNDPFQEELTFGTNTKVLLHKVSNFEVWLPIQATIKHMGGQVITIDAPLKTLTNYAGGLSFTYHQPASLVKRWLLDFYYVGFTDFSPQKLQAFKNGFGLYPVLSANISNFQASLGFWHGDNFISSKGEPLFQSVSATNPTTVIPVRNVVTFKTSFFKQIFKEISFAAYFESYYDLKISQMDYAYGITMSVAGDVIFHQR